MKDKIEFTVSMKVTIPQMLALKAMFEYWNILANIGASRFVGFYVDGDGDFHPNCLFFQSKETQELNDELRKLAVCEDDEGNRKYDYDNIAWFLHKEI